MIKELTTHMKPICMGRFVMNVPQSMVLDGDATLYYGLDKNFKTVDVTIESLAASPESMRSQMDANAEKLAHDEKNWQSKKPMLLDYRVVNDHMIYLRKYDDSGSAAASDHELHLLVGNTQVALTATSYENVPEAGRYEPDGKTEPPEKVADRLFELAKHIHGYEDPEQAGPGFCLGPVVIDSNQNEEFASLFMKMSKYPDLIIEISTKALSSDSQDKTLFERMTDIEKRPDTHMLHKGAATLGGMKATEWMAQGLDRDKKCLAFVMESTRPDPALARPSMQISLATGGQLRDGSGKYVDSSLSPSEAFALWRSITTSLRVRPNAVRNKQ